jgi:transcriptional regulator with XRE-family HTH domain
MKPEEMKRRREALRLTQAQLARELGLDSITVSRYERGVHPIPKTVVLAFELVEMRNRKEAA